MSKQFHTSVDPGQSMIYQIRLRGHLGPRWADWFGNLTISLKDNGDTFLTGPVVDQAALHGVLKKVRDVGLPLISVCCIDPDPSEWNDKEQI